MKKKTTGQHIKEDTQDEKKLSDQSQAHMEKKTKVEIIFNTSRKTLREKQKPNSHYKKHCLS